MTCSVRILGVLAANEAYNVIGGRGSAVTAGSVVTRSVSPMTVVQGNPAVPVAKCGIPLALDVTLKEFTRLLRPVQSRPPYSSGRDQENLSTPAKAEPD